MIALALLAGVGKPSHAAELAGAGHSGEPAPRPAWLQALDRRIGDLVSPRALARAHVGLEGISQCSECHDGLRATPDSRCLDCHEDLAARLRDRIGWHGRVTESCTACHPEHRGPDADLLGLDREGWNHEQAAWPLRGAHVEVACDDCHKRPGRDGTIAFHAQGIAFDRCGDCHEDVHGAAFLAERDCAACHTERSFRSEGLAAAGFDHARDAGFALEGEHARVPCSGCHGEERRAAERAAKTAPGRDAPRDCAGCHEDPHEGALGTRCAGCHDAGGWKAAGEGARFDHARDTRFPLDALHARLACTSCHEGLRFAAAGRECADCHGDAATLLGGDAGALRAAPDPHASAARCRDCHAAGVASPTLLDYERACLACHPAPYAALLVTQKRIVDGNVVKLEAALRTRELARRRGETPGPAESDEAIAAGLARIARSGLHHPTLSEQALLGWLEALGAGEAQP